MNSLLYRKSIARSGQLGKLYYAPNDSILNFSIYPTGTNPIFSEELQPKYSLDFIFDDISPIDLLFTNGSEEMKMSVVVNTSEFQTLRNFVKNRSLGSKPSFLNGFIVCRNISRKERLNYSNLALITSTCFTKESTHFIDEITYGAEYIIYFEREVSPIEDRIDIQNSFIKLFNSHLKGELSDMSFLLQFNYEAYKTSNELATDKTTILNMVKNDTISYPTEYRLSSISDLYNTMNVGGLITPPIVTGFFSTENISFRPDVNKRILDLLHERDNIIIETNDLLNSMDEQVIEHIDPLDLDLPDQFDQYKSEDILLRTQLFTELVNSRKSSSYQGLSNFTIDNTIFQQFLDNRSELKKNIHLIKYLKSNNIKFPKYQEPKDAFITRITNNLTCFLVNYNSFNSHFSNVNPFKVLGIMGSLVGTNIVCAAYTGPQETFTGIQVYNITSGVPTLLSEPTALLSNPNSNLVFRGGVNTAVKNVNQPVYPLTIKCPCGTCPNTKVKWCCSLCGTIFHYQRSNLFCKCTGGASITSCQFLCNRLYTLHTLSTMNKVYEYIPSTIDLSILFVSDYLDPGAEPILFLALKSLFLVSKSKDYTESLLTFNGFDDFVVQKFPNYCVYSNSRLQIVTTHFSYITSSSLSVFKEFDAIMTCDLTPSGITSIASYIISRHYENNVVFTYTQPNRLGEVILYVNNRMNPFPFPFSFKDVNNHYMLILWSVSTIIDRNEATLVQYSTSVDLISHYKEHVSLILGLFQRFKTFIPIIPY